MDLFDQNFKKYPKGFGIFLSIIGVMILTPDTMVMRFSNLDQWPLMGWRGVLMGVTLMLIWLFILKPSVEKELRTLYSWKGVVVIFAFSINSIFFTLGILETSVMLVLTALATMPVFAAILSSFMLKEAQGWLGWLTIIAAMVGVTIAVSDGNNAIGQPEGSIILGALFGAITAFGLALTFTMARKYPDLAVLPAGAIGALVSGIIGFALSSVEGVFNAPIWTVLCMGVIILPVSFTCLIIAPRYTTSAIVSLIMLLEMVIGPFWVWIGIGERPSIMMIFGSFLVLVVIAFHIFRTQFSIPQSQTPSK
jgi:drug/metabolite transporter (DMT)-like permease|tara:strand:- start:299 stop:1222 length:924 start_codon:yes stop_codon:yes gene_type:complete